MRAVYSFFFLIYTILFHVVALFHKRAAKMVKGHDAVWHILNEKIDPQASYLWFHASSIGEFEQGRPVMEALHRDFPQYKILLTFYSPSGESFQDYDKADIVCYLPFDRKRNVRRFLDKVRPVAAFFIKYEFWPNYLLMLHERSVPTYLVSGIFRPSQPFFKKYWWLHKQMLHCFSYFFVQNRQSMELLAAEGLADKAMLTGDTRSDRVIEIAAQAKELPLIDAFVKEEPKKCVMVAGSSWPPDEAVFIPYFNEHPSVKLIIAPRRIDEDHLKEIEHQIRRPFLRYTQLNAENVHSVDCILVDCIGILSSMYRYGDLAFIGGGFGTIGLHNVLEAAVYGKPVIIGPVYDKFQEAKDLLSAGGACSIADVPTLTACMDKWLSDEKLFAKVGRNAGDYVHLSAGSTNKIISYLESSPSSRIKSF